jgi:Domain of unknown function (DUF4157)
MKKALSNRCRDTRAGRTAAPAIVREALHSPGRPLDNQTRAFFEPRFQHDFGKVRVHTDEKAAESARAVNAHAYTVGPHIVFRTRERGPESPAGSLLLAHELAHVVQQENAPPARNLTIAARDSAPEKQAGEAAALSLATGAQRPSLSPAPQALQRAEESELPALDNPVVGTMAASIMGGGSWQFLREILRGLVGGTKSELQAGKGGAAVTRFKELLTSPSAMWKFSTGYLWGFAQGVVSPVVDLWHLLKFAFEIQGKAIDWILGKGLQFFRKPNAISQQGQAIMNSLAAVREQLGKVFQNLIDNPRQAIKGLGSWIDAMIQAAVGKAREAGRSIAESVFAFLEFDWNAMGEKIGYAVGAVLVQVLMLVFTEAIGNVLSAAGRILGEAGEFIASKATLIIRYVKLAGARVLEMLSALKGSVFKFVEGLASKVVELFNEILKFFDVAEAEIGPAMATAGEAPPEAMLSKAVKPPAAPTRTTTTTVEELTGRGKGGGGAKTTRVDPHEKKVDDPFKKLKEAREARAQFADQMKQRLPKGTQVDTVSIERTEAGRAQAAAVTPEGAPVAMDVELRIKLSDGSVFKPDGVRILNRNDYLFREHKEVLTLWERSHFSQPFARRELEIMLQQRADIYLKLKPYGCKGFLFTTNNETLDAMMAEIIGSMKGPGRQGLLLASEF